LSAEAKIDNRIAHELPRFMIGRLAAAVDRKKWMRQMRSAQLTRFVRRAPDGVNRFVLEQEHFVGSSAIFALSRNNVFLERKRVSEFDLAEPADSKIACYAGGLCRRAHICVAPGIPTRAVSCARTCVRPRSEERRVGKECRCRGERGW